MGSENLSAEIVCPQTLPSARKHYLASPQTLLKNPPQTLLIFPSANISLCICTKLSREILVCRTGPGFHFWKSWVMRRLSEALLAKGWTSGQLRSPKPETLAFGWCRFYRSLCTTWLAILALSGTAVTVRSRDTRLQKCTCHLSPTTHRGMDFNSQTVKIPYIIYCTLEVHPSVCSG